MAGCENNDDNDDDDADDADISSSVGNDAHDECGCTSPSQLPVSSVSSLSPVSVCVAAEI